MINGIHHVSFRCSGEQLRRVITFYSDTLGIPIIRRWGPDCDNPIGVMFDTGNGIIEVFSNAESDLPQGVIRHFALSVTDVDEAHSLARVRNSSLVAARAESRSSAS